MENEELARLAADLGDPRLQCDGEFYAAFWRLQSRDVSGARAAVFRGNEIAQRLGQPQLLWTATWLRAGLARLVGDLDEADAMAARALEIGTEGGMPDAPMFYAFQRLTLILDRCDPAAREELQMYCDLAPPHYPGGTFALATMDAALGHADRARGLIDPVAASPYAPWGSTGSQPDAALVFAGWLAGAEAALGEPSPWAGAAYDYLAPWPGQLFGNVTWHGPTESYVAALSPLAGHPAELDSLLETALVMCKEMRTPVNDLYARILGACGLRIRDRPGDRDRARRLVDEAVDLGDRLGAGIARAAAEHFPALRD